MRVSSPTSVKKKIAFDESDEASENSSGVGIAPGGIVVQSLAEESGASGTSLRNGTTRPSTRTRYTRGMSLGPMAGSSLEHLSVDPAQTRSRVRQHWTRQMNIGLINAYYEITEGETKTRKYADQLAERWRNMYPDKVFTGKHVIAHVRNIKTRKLLAPDELEALKATAMCRSPAANIRNIRRSLQRRSSIRAPQIRLEESDEAEQMGEPNILDEVADDTFNLFQEIRLKWEGTAFEVRPKISRLKNNPESRNLMQLLDAALKDTIQASANLEELSHIVYSAAITANTIQQTTSKIRQRGHNQQGKPPWESRLEEKIKRLRKEIGSLQAFLNSQRPSRKLEKKLQEYARRLGLKRKEVAYRVKLQTHLKMLKQKIAALGNRIRRYHKRTLRYRQNNLFANNQREFYRGLEKEKAEKTDSPTPDVMGEYWSKVWSQSTSHNENAAWIKTEEEEQRDLREMDAVDITEEHIRITVKRMKNWTAPGVDGIHNYWWKALKSTHLVLARLIKGALEQPHILPAYLTQGITYMIPKKGDLKKPENYRPITSLPSLYKIITSTISHQIDTHLKRNNIMAWEQNGCKNKGKGSKELLIVDRTITRQAKTRKKNISMAWIDYQKAYDSVPHSWLIKILKIYRVNEQIILLLQFLMSTWRTTITVAGHSTPGYTVKIRRGIFQGDGFSPRWFCLALNILSKLLNRSAYGYSMNESVKLSHLFYMDDIKLYARGRKQLEGEIELVRMFSDDIGMSLGLDKCAMVEVKRGKMVRDGNIRMADGREIAELAIEERYKYLGIQQTYEIKQTENKQNVKKELMTRVLKILKTQLSAKNKIEALNIWAIPTFTYSSGILTWSKTDLQQIDRHIRTTLTEHGMLHPNSATERLYLPRKQGGRGLVCIEAACLQEEKNIAQYFNNTDLPVHQWIATQEGTTDWGREENRGEPETENFTTRLERSWQAKALHGRFHASLHQPEVDPIHSNTYLTQGYLYPRTEGTLFAIQDQVVPTRTHSKYIMKLSIEDTRCRLCQSAEETVQHLSSACSAIAGTKYLARHNSMGKVVHQLLCLQYRLLPHFMTYHLYAPQPVMENEKYKIYWDLTVITDIGVEHNRPDVVIWKKAEKHAVIVDFAVPWDSNLTGSYGEKIQKYEALSRQIRDMWRLKRVDIMPMIISTNGLVHKKTIKHLKELNLPTNAITWMQKAVILGTVNIIRQVIFPH